MDIWPADDSDFDWYPEFDLWCSKDYDWWWHDATIYNYEARCIGCDDSDDRPIWGLAGGRLWIKDILFEDRVLGLYYCHRCYYTYYPRGVVDLSDSLLYSIMTPRNHFTEMVARQEFVLGEGYYVALDENTAEHIPARVLMLITEYLKTSYRD